MTGPTPRRLRVLTWNLHGCVGRGGRFDPETVIGHLRAIDPDVAALQEVDARGHHAGEIDTFALIAEATGHASLAARTLPTDAGDYGHMLLSRWALSGESLLDLSVPGREPRAAIVAKIGLPGLEVRVLSAHLGLSARERSAQIRRIRAETDRWGDGAGLVLGDFNEWRRRGIATRQLCPPFTAAAAPPSFPATRPLFALDRIWCRTPLAPHAARTVREARDASDHLPVLAELSLPGPAGGP